MAGPVDEQTIVLAKTLIDELVGSVGLPKTPALQRLCWFLLNRIMTQFAGLALNFDRITRDEGLPEGCVWALARFSAYVTARGQEHVPAAGPVLVVSNHPGGYDAFAIFARLNRTDIRWVSTEIPFLDTLPNVRSHVIFASRTDARSRMDALRNCISHLKSGGVLLYFGAGHRDPDPSIYPGAEEEIDAWLPGIEFFVRHVPGLQILPTIVSGIVTPRWAHHPITWLRRKPIDSRRLAEFGQIISLMIHPERQRLDTDVSFGEPLVFDSPRAEETEKSVMPTVIAREKAVLAEHLAWIRSPREPARP